MKTVKSKEYISLKDNTLQDITNEPHYQLYLHLPAIGKENIDKPINVLSLFSGCGGMDLGFEGGFTVHKKSINLKSNPDFSDNFIDNNFIRLKSTKFKTVFANDILNDAKTAWVNYFSKLGYNPEIFRSESIVDLVKMHKMGVNIFPQNIDIVTGGFPCQDFSLSGKRRGFNSHKDHRGK